jgi:hypothetical protein
MAETTFCITCALELAAGRWGFAEGMPEMVNGVCPECGGTIGLPFSDETVPANENAD